VKIPANSTGTTFNIATIDDKLVEGTENFVVKIENCHRWQLREPAGR
jgi:surface adhesion protein